eukprot:TRINITY_DN7081_c0_g1_i1.p1 TRINITY_DN7081_c0_g1~~TRINITY_DN7081_c0_g1_i1.p1  ORF type:complete len:242 (+),score=36.49 TRINITY_DN7081_c0_g1_i1:91-816(+)
MIPIFSSRSNFGLVRPLECSFSTQKQTLLKKKTKLQRVYTSPVLLPKRTSNVAAVQSSANNSLVIHTSKYHTPSYVKNMNLYLRERHQNEIRTMLNKSQQLLSKSIGFSERELEHLDLQRFLDGILPRDTGEAALQLLEEDLNKHLWELAKIDEEMDKIPMVAHFNKDVEAAEQNVDEQFTKMGGAVTPEQVEWLGKARKDLHENLMKKYEGRDPLGYIPSYRKFKRPSNIAGRSHETTAD